MADEESPRLMGVASYLTASAKMLGADSYRDGIWSHRNHEQNIANKARMMEWICASLKRIEQQRNPQQ